MKRTIGVLFAGLITLSACGGGNEVDDPFALGEDLPTTTTSEVSTTTTEPPDDPLSVALRDPEISIVARANVDSIEVWTGPGGTGELLREMPRHDPDYEGIDGEKFDQVFLVEESRNGWLKVLLPVRPNGSTGWIRATDVILKQHAYRIIVEIGEHRLIATKNGEPILDTTIAVGTQDTPTPGGKFYLNALIEPPNPNTIYGTKVYALSGYSDTLYNFAGGDGVIGIHGTNDPSVMGTSVSNGCIRMTNDDIEALAAVLPLGTPVEIRA